MEPEIKSSVSTESSPSEIKNIDLNLNQSANSSPEKIEESSKDINWRKFRQQREIERKQAEEMTKKAAEKEQEASALKAALDAILNKNQSSSTRQNFYEEDETDDQRIEKRVNAALEKKEQEYQQRRQEEERQNFPQKILHNHPDFNEICSSTNLDYLEYHYPEVASAFKYMPEGFDKWTNIYKAVKKFVPNTNTSHDEKKMEKNLSKPISSSSPTVSNTGIPTSSSRLDEQKKAANWARMKSVMNKVES